MTEKTITCIVPSLSIVEPDTMPIYNIATGEQAILPANNFITSVDIQVISPKPFPLGGSIKIRIEDGFSNYVPLFSAWVITINQPNVSWIHMKPFDTFFGFFSFTLPNNKLIKISTDSTIGLNECQIYLAIKYKEMSVGDRKY